MATAVAEPLAASLSKTAREFESLLSSSKCRPLDQFLEAPKLGASIPLMAELFKKAGVESRVELESAVKAQFRVAEVRDSWEELLDVEANWDVFLATVDSGESEGLRKGDLAPLQLPLVEAKTGCATSLGEILGCEEEGEQQQCLHLVLLRHFA